MANGPGDTDGRRIDRLEHPPVILCKSIRTPPPQVESESSKPASERMRRGPSGDVRVARRVNRGWDEDDGGAWAAQPQRLDDRPVALTARRARVVEQVGDDHGSSGIAENRPVVRVKADPPAHECRTSAG